MPVLLDEKDDMIKKRWIRETLDQGHVGSGSGLVSSYRLFQNSSWNSNTEKNPEGEGT